MTPRTGQLRASFDTITITLRWTEWGPVDGFPTLCVHGLTRNGRDFDALAQALAEQGRRVICPDMPGRGMSGWFNDPALYAVPSYCQALAPLLEAVGEHDWVGTSMGGLIGMALAAAPGSRMRRFVINDIGPFVPVAALERIRDYLSDRPAASGRYVLHYDPAILTPMQGNLSDVDLWPLWPAVATRPVLVLRGETSDLLLAETAAQMGAAETVRVETIAGCGHAPALMDPAQIELVRGFLA